MKAVVAHKENYGKEFQEAFLSRVAWLYFIGGLTQSEIAKQLGTTRLRINKALGVAREEGLVRIEIASPFAGTYELESQLVDRFGLSGARVGLRADTSSDYHEIAGSALSYYLDDLLAQHDIQSMGVSWGNTLERSIKNLKPQNRPDIEVVSLMGGLSRGTSINTFGIAASFATRLNAEYHLFAAPLYSESIQSAKALFSTTLLKEQIDKAVNVDVAVLVVGDMSEKSLVIREGLPKDVSLNELKEAGAVGDILGRFLNKNGKLVNHPINKRAIGPPHHCIAEFKQSILAAAGTHKVPIMHAVLKAGLISTLITDNHTAELLLKYE